MRFTKVCLAGLAVVLPDEVVTSDAIEERLAPLYQRLRLPTGRLELMTGIRERRVSPEGTLPSGPSAVAGRAALDQSPFSPDLVGTLIHASVCRDQLEPATACGVHRQLGLRDDCSVFDLSNACLGMLNGILQVATQIESGQIQAGLIVGTENSRPLVENTIRRLNQDQSLSRDQIKPALASLTIGSASAAVLLAHRDLAGASPRLVGGITFAATQFDQLCQGGHDPTSDGGQGLWMETDAEQLLRAGVTAAQAAFARFLNTVSWSLAEIDKTICHQVGGAHRKLLLETLGLPAARDFCTYPTLGNTGSVAVPVTAAFDRTTNPSPPGSRSAWLGIGSGINVVMLGWETPA